jgi:hypothetical protein
MRVRQKSKSEGKNEMKKAHGKALSTSSGVILIDSFIDLFPLPPCNRIIVADAKKQTLLSTKMKNDWKSFVRLFCHVRVIIMHDRSEFFEVLCLTKSLSAKN